VMLSLIGAIVAEFVGAQKGLGVLIMSMTYTMDVAGQFSVLIVLSLLGLLLHTIIVVIRKRLLFWDTSQNRIADAPIEGEM
jgi:NitT/TauT family transport system permease protein